MLYEIDPNDVTRFNRSDSELEAFLLFAILVAGKKASMQSRKLKDFLTRNCAYEDESPFDIIRRLIKDGDLAYAIRVDGLGQYRKLETCLPILVNAQLDLNTCSVEELEAIPFIAMKTSRFFVLHSRQDAQYAALDVHILRYMRENMDIDTPRQTPSSKKQYLKLEQTFLKHCETNGLTPSNFDLAIWMAGANKQGMTT